MSWRRKSLGAREIRPCFHLKSLRSPKSEYYTARLELFVYSEVFVTRVHLAHRYYANTETYLKAIALKRMPPNLQTVDMLKAGTILLLFSSFLLSCSLLYLLPSH